MYNLIIDVFDINSMRKTKENFHRYFEITDDENLFDLIDDEELANSRPISAMNTNFNYNDLKKNMNLIIEAYHLSITTDMLINQQLFTHYTGSKIMLFDLQKI